MKKFVLVFAASIFLCGNLFAQITANQFDDFEDGTTQGWGQGGQSPNPPTNIATGGPAGAEDNYLQIVSAGGSGAGSKLVAFNSTKWVGDYNAAGVTAIAAMMNNFGSTALEMRVRLNGPGGNFFSTSGIALAAGSGWTAVVFPLGPNDLTGGTNLSQTLGGVTQLRIIHDTNSAHPPTPIAATLGVDIITAGSVPVSVEVTGSLNLPETHQLVQNYPNPFNPATTISFAIANSNFVSLKIYDIRGHEIQTLVNKFLNAGSYSMFFQAAKISSGTYFYKLKVGSEFVEIKKMVLIR